MLLNTYRKYERLEQCTWRQLYLFLCTYSYCFCVEVQIHSFTAWVVSNHLLTWCVVLCKKSRCPENHFHCNLVENIHLKLARYPNIPSPETNNYGLSVRINSQYIALIRCIYLQTFVVSALFSAIVRLSPSFSIQYNCWENVSELLAKSSCEKGIRINRWDQLCYLSQFSRLSFSLNCNPDCDHLAFFKK